MLPMIFAPNYNGFYGFFEEGRHWYLIIKEIKELLEKLKD